MNLELTGKRALVLGGSGGLGKAVAMSLAAEGAIVLITGRTPETLEKTAAEIKANGGTVKTMVWDLKDIPNVATYHAQAVEALGGSVEILFNNGGGPPPSPAQGQPVEKWREQFESMVLSLISVTDAVLPGMLAANWGRIITNTSSGVITPIANLAMSNSLRSSLVGWSKTLATEVAEKGITVNIVVPGRIATDRLKFLDGARAKREGSTLEEVENKSKATIPAKRYGNPREYGDTVAFLASARASYITGSMIRVDGGVVPNV